MKKIIIGIPYLTGKGGTEAVIKNFYDAVVVNSREKYDWLLVSFGGSKYKNWMSKWNKKVYKFTNNRLIQYILYIFLLPVLIFKTLKNENPDYFIATNPVIWSLSYSICKYKRYNTKIVAWYHYSYIKKHIKSKYLKKVDYFWAISDGIKKELISMGVSENKISVIYNPVPNPKNMVQRTGKQNHFIYIGRIDYDGQKNVSELIRALNKATNDFRCDLYGNIDDNTKNKLLNLISDNKKINNIKFHGFFEDVWEQIHKADVLILTSKYEGFGMVLCEAASRGISLISSDCPMGPSEIVNKNNGYLYEMGNTKELNRLIDDILLKNKILPTPEVVKHSIQKFSYEKYASRIFNFFDRLD